MKLLAITDRRKMGADPIGAIAALMEREGARLIVQVREKDLDARVLYEWLRALVPRRGSARLMVNGRADVAACFPRGVVGVQLPEDGLAVADARRVLGPSACIGRSVHDEAGAIAAVEAGADLLVVSPVFETESKPGVVPLGAGGLATIVQAVRGRAEIYGLGGISRDRFEAVMAAGVDGVAGISAFW